jgi:multidrug resistance efflux pump
MKRTLLFAVTIIALPILLVKAREHAAVKAEIPVGAELRGKLKAVRAQEGQRVRQGQILAILENDDYAAACALAVTQLRQARGETEVAAARARVDQAYAMWYKTFVRAPLSGVVVRKNLQAGDTVSETHSRPVVTLIPQPSAQ